MHTPTFEIHYHGHRDFQSTDSLPVAKLKELVEMVCTLVTSQTREVVQTCLSFIKGVVSLYPPVVLGTFLKTIIQGICNMTPDCARNFRIKVKSLFMRLMRKFGSDYICSEYYL